MRILLIEDDSELGEAVRDGLIKEHYTVDWVQDGLIANEALKSEIFDLVILDLGLPKLSGMQILHNFRHLNKQATPVLILTANESSADHVEGLDSGADDYLTKPFDFLELKARLRALLRRVSARTSTLLTHHDIILDPIAHTVSYKGKPVHLSRRELALLRLLLENVGRVLSRERLTQSLYGWNDEIDSNALEVHVHNLRKRFGEKLILTIRGVGYIIQAITK